MASQVEIETGRDDPRSIVAQVSAACQTVSTTSAGNTMVWRIWGQGEPVVLLHGGYGSWTHWIRNVEYFAQFHQVLVPDMPGYGDSPLPQGVHSMHDYAGLISAGLEDLLPQGQAYHLVGFSFGSGVATHLLQFDHRRIKRLVIVATSALGPRAVVSEHMRRWRGLAAEEERLAAHRHNLGVLMIHKTESIDPLAVYLQSRNAERARLRSKTIPPRGDRKQLLTMHPRPLAGIWGAEDAMSRDYLAERQAALMEIDPDCAFAIIPGAGHWVPYEAADEFNAALRSILLR